MLRSCVPFGESMNAELIYNLFQPIGCVWMQYVSFGKALGLHPRGESLQIHRDSIRIAVDFFVRLTPRLFPPDKFGRSY